MMSGQFFLWWMNLYFLHTCEEVAICFGGRNNSQEAVCSSSGWCENGLTEIPTGRNVAKWRVVRWGVTSMVECDWMQ